MPNFYNNGRQGMPVGDWGNYQGGYNGYQTPQYPPQPMAPHQQIFVQGEAGANAFQMPQGCNFIILWEADPNIQRFYIKQVDNNGRPLPVESYDYTKHVDPPVVYQPDLSKYVTIDQFQEFLASQKTPTTTYVTQDQLKELVGKLSVGSQGRIVVDESGV